MIDLIIGTETGTAEYVADEVLELLAANNIQAKASLEPKLEELKASTLWMVITSTHGAGEIPPNLQPFIQSLSKEDVNLSGQKLIIIALGDSNYDTFCQAGISISEQLTKLNSELIAPILKVDAMEDEMPEDIVIRWLTDYLPKIIDLDTL